MEKLELLLVLLFFLASAHNFMPLLILHCRTRLFLAFVQQRAILGGARTQTYVHTVAGTVNEFHIIPHQISIVFTFRYSSFEKMSNRKN